MGKYSKTVPISALIFMMVIIITGFTSINAADSGNKDEKAWMGIYMQDLSDDISEALDLDVKEGVLINEIIGGSPAEKAGLKDGDVVVRFDNEVIDNSKDLSRAVKSRKSGDKVNIVFFRDGKKSNVDLVLGSAETEDSNFSLNTSPRKPYKKYQHEVLSYGYMGVMLQNIGNQLAEYFEVENGVLISQVEEDSPADKAGLKAGDVITAIDDEEVDSPSEVSEIIRDHEKGDKVEIAYVRKGADRKTTIEIDDKEMDAKWFGMDNLNGEENIFMIPGLENIPYDFDFDLEFSPDDVNTFKHYNDDIHKEMDELREEINDLQKELKKLQKQLD